MYTLRIIGGIRSHLITRLPEWALAGEMAAEGARLVLGGSTFHSTHAFHTLSELVDETFWGWLALGIAVSWGLALFLNGTFVAFRRISPWVRSMSAFVAAMYWGVWTVTMFESNPDGTGWINHFGYSALSSIFSVLIAREVGATEVKYR